jgi:uncharacterized OsmC-like protein
MSIGIRDAVQQTKHRLEESPDAARSADRPAIAVLDGGLRCRVEAPDGSVLITDMPASLGGGGSAPTAGWLARAARASCLATRIAMHAAECGVELETVEVVAESESDTRGLLGLDETVPPGPLRSALRVRIVAPDVDDEKLRELVEWAEAHSPVSDLVTRAVPSEVTIEREVGALR